MEILSKMWFKIGGSPEKRGYARRGLRSESVADGAPAGTTDTLRSGDGDRISRGRDGRSIRETSRNVIRVRDERYVDPHRAADATGPPARVARYLSAWREPPHRTDPIDEHE